MRWRALQLWIFMSGEGVPPRVTNHAPWRCSHTVEFSVGRWGGGGVSHAHGHRTARHSTGLRGGAGDMKFSFSSNIFSQRLAAFQNARAWCTGTRHGLAGMATSRSKRVPC